MKKVLECVFAVVAFAVFAAGCGKNAASADEVAALRKEVAELRAEIEKVSRGARNARQMSDDAMPERVERRAMPIRPAVRDKDGGDAKRGNYERVDLTPEQRKSRIEELRKRHLEKKNASKEQRAQRKAARAGGGEGQGVDKPAAEAGPASEVPQTDSVQ